MKKRVVQGVAGVVAAALVGAGAAVATTVASIVGSDGVIHGCYATQTGVLRVVAEGTACRANEQAIEWNQVGPEGPQGPVGPMGPHGERGPSNAYSVVRDAVGEVAPSTTTIIARLDVPAGSYVVNAKLIASNFSTTEEGGLVCSLFGGKLGDYIEEVDRSAARFAPASGASRPKSGTVAWVGTVTLAESGNVFLQCQAIGDDVWASYARIAATQVATLG